MSERTPRWPRAVLQRELFDQRMGGRGFRLTQDSPVLPNVWMEYAKNPGGQQELLISPVRGERSGTVVRDLRKLVKNLNDNDKKLKLRWGDKPARIAHVPGLIIASLYFNELMRLVLFSSAWWSRCTKALDEALDLYDKGGKKIEVVFPLKGEAKFRVIDWIAREWKTSDDPSGLAEPRPGVPEPPYDFLKLIRVVGMISIARDEDRVKALNADDGGWERLSATELVEAFNDIFVGFPAKDSPSPNTVWGVTLNREAEHMIGKSVKSMKADAARRLFNVSCDGLRWAVIDSGIDAQHPAFTDWRARDHRLLPRSHRPRPTLRTSDDRPSRVVRTYDFAYLRDLLDYDFLSDLKFFYDNLDKKDPADILRKQLAEAKDDEEKLKLPRLALRLVETAGLTISPVDRENKDIDQDELREDAVRRASTLVDQLMMRIDQGLEIDWATIEPLIEDVTPDPPILPHGTQVAGVLAAHWCETEREELGPPNLADDPTKEKAHTQEEMSAAAKKDARETFRAGPYEGMRRRMTGVCEDIELVDLRVVTRVGDRVAPHDFEVISALKFIGYLNSRADDYYIHGANLSVAIPHDVRSFACGRTPVCEECETLVSSGVCVVVAAGNGGYSESESFSDSFYRPGSISDPGNAESVITVGATHRQHPHEYGVSFFSSRGPTGDGRRKPDLVAPGEKIETPSPGQRSAVVDGTSFAAPHVSGAAAMLMARYSEMIGQPLRIKQILCSTATDLGRERDYQGHGMLDVLRALQSL